MPGFDDDLRELLLEHYRHPRHRGHLIRPTHTARRFNRYCGEAMTVEVEVEGDIVKEVAFDGDVCSVSQAAASLMTDYVAGKKLEDVRKQAAQFEQMMLEGEPDPDLGAMSTLHKVAAFPSRVRCALLSWEALLQAIGSDDAGSPS